MSKLSQPQIDAAVARSLNELDPSEARVEGPSPYKNLIDINNIKGRKISHRILKKIVSPYVRINKKIFEKYFDQQTWVDSYLVQEISVLRKRVDEMPSILDLSSALAEVSVLSAGVLDNKYYETQKLIDKFKKEILFELVEIKGGSAVKGEYIKPETKVLNKKRAESLKKINIGCGTDIREDYINVDHRAIDGVDVVADVLDLPFPPNSLDEVFASHVAEHFIEKDLKAIIKYWFSLLSEGGVIRLIVPNIEEMAKRYAHGEISWEQLRSVALGGQDYASDYHFNHFSVKSMEKFINDTLPRADFVVVDSSRQNGECYEMEVLVRK